MDRLNEDIERAVSAEVISDELGIAVDFGFLRELVHHIRVHFDFRDEINAAESQYEYACQHPILSPDGVLGNRLQESVRCGSVILLDEHLGDADIGQDRCMEQDGEIECRDDAEGAEESQQGKAPDGMGDHGDETDDDRDGGDENRRTDRDDAVTGYLLHIIFGQPAAGALDILVVFGNELGAVIMRDGNEHGAHDHEGKGDFFLHPSHEPEGRDDREQHYDEREEHTSESTEARVQEGQHDHDSQSQKHLQICSHLQPEVVSDKRKTGDGDLVRRICKLIHDIDEGRLIRIVRCRLAEFLVLHDTGCLRSVGFRFLDMHVDLGNDQSRFFIRADQAFTSQVVFFDLVPDAGHVFRLDFSGIFRNNAGNLHHIVFVRDGFHFGDGKDLVHIRRGFKLPSVCSICGMDFKLKVLATSRNAFFWISRIVGKSPFTA